MYWRDLIRWSLTWQISLLGLPSTAGAQEKSDERSETSEERANEHDPSIREQPRIVVTGSRLPDGTIVLRNGSQPDQDDIYPRQPRGNLNSLITADDYPRDLVAQRVGGTVRVKMFIDKEGKVSACEVKSSSGNASLDLHTCKLMQERARFTPALDENGEPVEGSHTQSFRWQVPANFVLKGEDETEFDFDKGFRLFVDYSANGRINACMLNTPGTDWRASCGPFYQTAHEIFRHTARRVESLEKGVILFERGTSRKTYVAERIKDLTENARLLDHDLFVVRTDKDGTVEECRETVSAKLMHTNGNWACDDFENGMPIPCPANGESCAGEWVHYRLISRLADDPDVLFPSGMLSPPLKADPKGT